MHHIYLNVYFLFFVISTMVDIKLKRSGLTVPTKLLVQKIVCNVFSFSFLKKNAFYMLNILIFVVKFKYFILFIVIIKANSRVIQNFSKKTFSRFKCKSFVSYFIVVYAYPQLLMDHK